ncbi:AIR synthase family protein [Gudongella sp. DL1XJH-153]|uniref:AIR synthase family protein n=1 Tax=Gudongella sp. DL1XJH-153 TaxID=3409804 RepID=UPI003BB634D5
MEIGKVPNELLEKIVFNNISLQRDEVLVRASIGEDTGVMDLGGDLCVVSTDPITGATKALGALAVHVSCNDAATKGAEPVALLLTILCPDGTGEKELEEVMKEAGEAAAEVNVEIIGGHTEITDAVTRMVLSTTVIARMKREHLYTYESIKLGDKVVISKWIGLEGTHILASELRGKLGDKFSQDEIQEAIDLGRHLSVVKEGIFAKKHGVKYMHDITEGGIYGAIWETGKAIGKGIDLFEDQLPVQDITKRICDHLGVDVRKLISSGSMIMVVPDESADNLIQGLDGLGVPSTLIAEVTEAGIFSVKNGDRKEIKSPGTDELYRALEI